MLPPQTPPLWGGDTLSPRTPLAPSALQLGSRLRRSISPSHNFNSWIRLWYGKNFVVYNIHSFLHVGDDVRYFDASLDHISAFRYENYLQTLKRLIRVASNSFVQIFKRLQKYESVHGRPFVAHHEKLKLKLSCQDRDSNVYLSRLHNS